MMLAELIINTDDDIIVYTKDERTKKESGLYKDLYKGFSKNCNPLLLHREVLSFSAREKGVFDIEIN